MQLSSTLSNVGLLAFSRSGQRADLDSREQPWIVLFDMAAQELKAIRLVGGFEVRAARGEEVVRCICQRWQGDVLVSSSPIGSARFQLNLAS